MKTKIFFKFKKLLPLITMLFIFVACGDEPIKNEQISNDNVSKLKLLQDTAELEKQDIVIDNTERLNEIRDSILSLEQTSQMLNDSLNFYTGKLTELSITIDDLTKKKNYVSETDQKAKSKITANIAELESLINSLKTSKANEEKNLIMIGKRKELISKKNEALKSELDFNQMELNDLYTKTNAQDKIEKVTSKINEINNEILKNKNLILDEEINEKLSTSKIVNLDNQITSKQKQFKTEYEKSTGIKDYVESEVEDLVYKINNLEIQKSELSNKWKVFRTENDNVKLKLQNLEEVKNQLLSPIQAKVSVDTTKADNNLVALETKKKQNEELSTAQQLIDENEESDEGSSSIFYWLIIIIIVVIVSLYYLGKKNKSKNSNKDLGEENE